MTTSNYNVLFIIIVLLSILLFIGLRNVVKRKKTMIHITSKFHYTVISIFVILLLVTTIIVEWFYPSSKASHLPPKSDVDLYNYPSPSDSILNGETPDESHLIAKRTHEIGDTLTIGYLPDVYGEPEIWVERKDVNDGTIEEFVYKQLFTVDEYDFSNEIDVTLPEWQKDSVTFLQQPTFTFEFVSFSNSTILNQLIEEKNNDAFPDMYGSTSGPAIVHLIVPKDLEIIDPLDSVQFIDE